MKVKLEQNHLSQIYKKPTIGVPMTPGKWTSEPSYKKVSVINTNKPIFNTPLGHLVTEHIPIKEFYDALNENCPMFLITYDDKGIKINPKYIVSIQDFTLVTRKYHSENPNFPTGEYTCRWLLPLNETVEFVDEFISN